MKAFNLNDSVYVKLTEKGLAIWKANFEQYDHLPYMAKQRKDYPFEEHAKAYSGLPGYHQFQLHQLMEIFGTEMQNGNAMPFGEIIMAETDLKDAPEARAAEQFLQYETERILLDKSGKKYKTMGDIYEDIYPEIVKKYGTGAVDKIKEKVNSPQ